MSNHAEFERRIGQLEAENKELRSLWIETEGDVIRLQIRLDNRLSQHNRLSQRLLRALKLPRNRQER